MAISDIIAKDKRMVIGLMSGTSLDGMDAALVSISGCGLATQAELVGFVSLVYPQHIREALFAETQGEYGGSHEYCRLDSLVGQLSADACLEVCRQAGINPQQIDLVGSHGQTVYHMPVAEEYLGYQVRGTLQLGDSAIIAEKLGCAVVSDFRIRDMAAGGQGAPLVPYTEYLLYRREDYTLALQNIGGISNVTILPANCGVNEVVAFDTGPGNVLLDSSVQIFSGGKLMYDENGRLGGSGNPVAELENWLLERDKAYLTAAPPKSTGREHYSGKYVMEMLSYAAGLGLSEPDIAATLAKYTAVTIAEGLRRFAPTMPEQLIVCGGGSYNPAILRHLALQLPQCRILTGSEAGINPDAKEAMAFAVLANETIHELCGNLPSVTGAKHPVVMGKIQL